MLRKHIYQWHRISSLIIAVPVLLWAASGILHPVMTSFRPAVASQTLADETVDSSRIRMPLQSALQRNHIDTLYGVRLVHIDTSWFYQVQSSAAGRPEYFSALNGQRLKRGDWLYAQHLARQFLEGDARDKHNKATGNAVAMAGAAQDCCDAATDCVMHATGAVVTNVSLVEDFTPEYKKVNRLLPVYRVDFDRPDGIRIYVETGKSRFALAVDNRRAAFTTFFSLVHTFGWLSIFGKGRLVIEVLFLVLAFATTLMGLYIFFITKSKKVKGNSLMRARKYHRFTAVTASLFTLLFTFSGAWHAISGFKEEMATAPLTDSGIPVDSLHFNLPALQAAAGKPVSNIGVAAMNGQVYWQVYTIDTAVRNTASGDLMRRMAVTARPPVYVRVTDNMVLRQGDELYARYLAAKLTGIHAIPAATFVTRFTEEYNFTDKRLPVWRIAWPATSGERLFIETTTGLLCKRMTDADVYEGISFAIFHKHHFMDFAGKSWRDASTIWWAAMQVVMVVFGLVLYFRWRKKRRTAS